MRRLLSFIKRLFEIIGYQGEAELKQEWANAQYPEQLSGCCFMCGERIQDDDSCACFKRKEAT